MNYENNFDEEKFLKSDLVIRLYDFARHYDNIFSKDIVGFLDYQLEEKYYDNIKHFLRVSPIETTISFNLKSFSKMTVEYFLELQNRYKEISDLMDEKKNLYNEFLWYYNHSLN